MPLPDNIKKFLDQSRVKYTLLKHERALTAQEVAHSVHITGKEVAKCIIASADGKMVMVAVPAPHRLDIKKLKSALRAKDVRLPGEEEFKGLFPESEPGAMPPLGPAYGMPVYMDKSLMEYSEVVFNACTHTEVIRMAMKDFEALVKPTVGEFSAMPAS